MMTDMTMTNVTEPAFCAGLLQKEVYRGLLGNSVFSSDVAANVLQLFGLGFLYHYLGRLRSGKSKAEVLLPMYDLYVTVLIRLALFWTVVNMLGIFPTQLSGSGAVGSGTNNASVEMVVATVVVGLNWGSYHFLFDLVVVMLLYPGFGRNTIVHSLKCAAVTGTISGISVALINANIHSHTLQFSLILSLAWGAVYSTMYAFVWLWPSQKFSCLGHLFYRRPAVRYYALWWFIIRSGDFLVTFFVDTPFFPGASKDLGVCGHFLFAWLLWGIGWPVILLKTLRRDTIYWAGGFNNCQTGPLDDLTEDLLCLWYKITCRHRGPHPDFASGQRTISTLRPDDIRRPLFELGFNASESASVRRGLDSVPAEILIQFCELSLDASVVLGTGGTARVFVGQYKHKPVAIKMITCFELTPEIVSSFFEEAKLLYRCSEHPNVLDMYGICVAPPTLCLILELAKGGDLTTDLAEYADHKQRQAGEMMALKDLCLDRAELLKFLSDAIQCAKPVAYLHQKVPPVLHRDIKSMNYLVSIEEEVSTLPCYKCPFNDKVGAILSKNVLDKTHRNLSQAMRQRSASRSYSNRRSISFQISPNGNTELGLETNVHFDNKMSRNRVIKLADLGLAMESMVERDKNIHEGMSYSLLWAAPEVLRGEASTEKSDVYSLIVVLWEILNPGVQPYDDVADIAHISEQIQSGLRPSLGPLPGPMELQAKSSKKAYEDLHALFVQGWHADPAERPTAIGVLACLEKLHQQLG